MPPASQVRVKGLRELNRDFGKLSKKVQKELRAQLREVAEPAADLIRGEAASHGFSERSVSGIRAGSRRGGAVVRQARRKTTGTRADFGGIQFRFAFIPGAEEAEPVVEEKVEEWLDDLADNFERRVVL